MAFARFLQGVVRGFLGDGIDSDHFSHLDEFEYGARLGDRSIRLLKIEAGGLSQPIRCHVSVHSIDSVPDFEALSYVWGDANDTAHIICDGRKLELTKNLYDALLQLRNYNDFREGRLIWIDAICINQRDNTEKTAQVRMMREIYSKASLTVIWLGLGDDNAVAGLTLIRDIDKIIIDNSSEFASLEELGATVYGCVQSHIAASGTSHVDGMLTWLKIWEIFMRKWFGRVWVVQEYLLSANSYVLCGDCVTQPEILFRVALALRPSRSLGIAMATFDLSLDVMQPVQLAASSFAALAARYQSSPAKLKLHEMVHETYDFGATDPRDRIFALVGVASDVDPDFVDYDLDTRAVHINLAKNALRARDRGDGGYLDILSYVGPPDESETEALTLPSWVPNLTHFSQRWSGNFQPLAALLHPVDFIESGFSLTRIPLTFGADESLSIAGSILDTISSVIDDAPYSWVMSASAFPPEVFQQVALDLETWERDARQAARRLSKYSDAAYARILSFIPDLPSERAQFAEVEASYSDFCRMISLYPRAHNALVKRQQEGIEDPSYETLTTQLAEAAQPCKEFASRFDKYSKGRVFAGTAQGRMAWVPMAANPGDCIVALLPSRIPFVLRPTAGAYRLLGDAFVQGLMAGEVFDKLGENAAENFVIY